MNIKESLLITLIAALAGGFFVFVFERLSSFVNRMLDRRIKHFNALVFYEEQLNRNLSRLYDITFTIPHIADAIGAGSITWNNLKTIEFDKSFLANIHSIQLRNSLALYEVDTYKLNDDMEGLMEGYKVLMQAFIEKNITPEEYLVNCKEIIKNLDLIYSFAEIAINKLLDALTDVRLRIKTDKPKTSILIAKLITFGLKDYSEKKFTIERQLLEKEIQEISNQRKKEIDKILDKDIKGRKK
ncbi:MAG: hypothetical protein PHU86_03430 [Patescibacteria group bacterium]|nr:hypothetical protein [Patescibacteria group bacterium]